MNGPYPARTPQIERTRHRAHETVSSGDLNGQEASQEALRAWHNRALHATYGVVFGLVVRLEGEPGAFCAVVAPGLAYDATGRDLLLRDSTSIPLPFDAEGMTLSIRATRGEPALVWSPTTDFRIARGVPVARTVDGATRTEVTLLGPSLPPSLVGKVTFEVPDGRLTVRGILSARQQSDLLDAVTPGSRDKVRSIYNAWPYEAPRQSRFRGLDVSVAPHGPKEFSGEPQDFAQWQAVIAPGTAVNSLGRTLVVETQITLPLSGGSDQHTLILKEDGTPALVATATGAGDVVLSEIGSPADPVIKLASPVQEDIPEFLTILGDLKDTKQKIAYASGGLEITLTGFLSHDEAGSLIRMVSDNPESIRNAFARLRNDSEANRPVVPKSAADVERVPLFPPRSRPLARPRVAGGSSLPGRTEWKLVSILRDLVGYEATINIEAAGFTEPPQVFAWVERVRDASEEDQGSLGLEFPLPFRGGIVAATRESTPTRVFVFRLWKAGAIMGRVSGDDVLLPEWLRANLYVHWLAVQSDPPPDWAAWPDSSSAQGGARP